MSAEGGMVCAVKQGSAGMELQPVGVEQKGVVWTQSGSEAGLAQVGKVPDVAAHGGQGGQQRHLRA
jgi:hypothetical protein